MPFIGPWEIALILVIILIIFGPKKLPELAKSIGDAIRQYRQAQEGTVTSTQPSQPTPSRTKETDLLIETAKKLGIQTEGKTMEQISKEITEAASKSVKEPN
jgi:sec-independent protein translocase protein TatA